MGFFDRFRSKKGKDQKRTHIVKRAKEKDDTTALFEHVPAAGRDGSVSGEKKDSEKGKETVAKKKTEELRATGPAYRVLVRPLVTEKSSMGASHGEYAFAVHPATNKVEVAEAIAKVYGVRPTRVRMVNLHGKAVRYGRHEGVTASWKKAVVRLPKGKTIDVFEN